VAGEHRPQMVVHQGERRVVLGRNGELDGAVRGDLPQPEAMGPHPQVVGAEAEDLGLVRCTRPLYESHRLVRAAGRLADDLLPEGEEE